MPKVVVHIVRQTITEEVFAGQVEVDDATLRLITDRPLQAKYWAESVLPYDLDEDAWMPLNEGRKLLRFEAKQIEVVRAKE